MTKQIQLTTQQETIGRLSAMGQTPEEIATQTNASPELIYDTLNLEPVKKYKEFLFNDMNTNLSIRRLKGAMDNIDQFIALSKSVIDILSENPMGVKIHHVKLIELLIKEIPKMEIALNKNTANFNFKPEEKKKAPNKIDRLLQDLPAEWQTRFWQAVENLAEEYFNQYQDNKQTNTIIEANAE